MPCGYQETAVTASLWKTIHSLLCHVIQRGEHVFYLVIIATSLVLRFDLLYVGCVGDEPFMTGECICSCVNMRCLISVT